MTSILFNNELVEKYGLPKETITDAVCISISKTLGRAMRTKVFTQEGDQGIEIYALKRDILSDDSVIRIRPATIKKKLMRHLHYNIERELHSRKVLTDFDRYGDLQSQLIKGHITAINRDGTLEIALERNLLFENITLRATCPVRCQPPHERGNYIVDKGYLFYVSKIRPGQVRGMPRLDIKLDRKSPKMTEGLIRKGMEEIGIGLQSETNRFKCVKRICGAFSQIEAEKKIDREIIKSVSRELQENVFVKFGINKNVQQI